MSKKQYLKLVKKDGRNLEYVPYELRNRKLCLAAVREDGYALKYVPEHLKEKLDMGVF